MEKTNNNNNTRAAGRDPGQTARARPRPLGITRPREREPARFLMAGRFFGNPERKSWKNWWFLMESNKSRDTIYSTFLRVSPFLEKLQKSTFFKTSIFGGSIPRSWKTRKNRFFGDFQNLEIPGFPENRPISNIFEKIKKIKFFWKKWENIGDLRVI